MLPALELVAVLQKRNSCTWLMEESQDTQGTGGSGSVCLPLCHWLNPDASPDPPCR